jgi:hypothetical protein
MKATLTPTWELSTEHAASSDGHPVLVDRETGDAYGPDDIVQLYPRHGFILASEGVRRLAKGAHLDADGLRLVERFIRAAPPR